MGARNTVQQLKALVFKTHVGLGSIPQPLTESWMVILLQRQETLECMRAHTNTQIKKFKSRGISMYVAHFKH